MEKKIRPLGDRVLVKRDKPEEQTRNGIIIPQAAQETACEGTVIAVGKGRVTEAGLLVEPRVKKGDRVVFGKYAGQEAGNRFEPSSEQVVLREDDIIGVIEEG